MITVTIDGRDIEVAEGTTVLEAAKALGIVIPTLCHDDRLKPYGACRLCIVEIEGMRKPVTSCTTPATDNMIVKTNSEKLYRLRKTTVELLLSDHPNDCMTCVGTGDCTLQELAYKYGIRKNRFEGEMRDHHRIDGFNRSGHDATGHFAVARDPAMVRRHRDYRHRHPYSAVVADRRYAAV